MDTLLSIPDVEKLVAERAREIGRPFDPERVHVYENAYPSSGRTLTVQISAKRPANREEWIRLWMRFSRAVRDTLVEHGDERFPVVQVFEPEEWAECAGRDD
jgi:hypothetical protein